VQQAASTARGRLYGAWPVVAIVACYLLLPLLISPLYEVPQNDDWAYFQTLRIWFDSGELRHIGWNDPTLVFQLWWGALFAKLFGLSYTSLRVSTLILSCLGTLSLYGILRELERSRTVAFLGAGVLLFDPLYLTLTYSFNTDVPYVAMATAATWLVLRSLDRPSWPMLSATGFGLACAYLIRQQALAMAVVAAVALWLAARRESDRASRARMRIRTSVTLLLPIAIAALGYRAWLPGATYGGWDPAWSATPPLVANPTVAVLGDTLFQAFREGLGILLNLGVLGLPVALAAIGAGTTAFRRHPGLRWVLPGTILFLAGVSVWLSFDLSGVPVVGDLLRGQPEKFGPPRGWPYVGNYLSRFGTLPAVFWGLLGVVAPIGAGWMVAAAVKTLSAARRDAIARKTTVVLLLGLVQFLPSLVLATVYDRYLLVILPALVAVGACWGRVGRIGRSAAVAGLLLLAVFSVEWTRAHLDLSRALWEVSEELVERGVPPSDIAASFEWSGAHLYLEAVDRLGAHPPYDLEVAYPWDLLETGRHLVAVFPPQIVDRLSIQRSYRGFFRRERRVVGVLGPIRPPEPVPPVQADQDQGD